QQRRIRRDDASGAARTVAELGRDDEDARAAFLHALHAFFPALDDPTGAEIEFEGVVAILARIEFGAFRAAVVKPARVVDANQRPGLGALAGTGHGVVVLQPGGGRLHRRILSAAAKTSNDAIHGEARLDHG